MKLLGLVSYLVTALSVIACGSSAASNGGSGGSSTASGGEATGGRASGGATSAGGSSSVGASSSGGVASVAGGSSSHGGASATAGSTSGGMTSDGGVGGATAGGVSTAGGSSGSGGSNPGTGLHVVGNHLEDNGKIVRLIGWNRPGGEYSCVNNTRPAVFDGPTDLASIQAMQAWAGFNTVRLPLNETCWLGINGVNAAVSGANYIAAVAKYVSLFRQNGIYVMVEMHWNAPGTFVANTQMPMADADHAVEFWKQVANQFKNDLGVLLDLYNEPHLDNVPAGGFVAGTNSADAWSCWLNGGCTITPQTWEQQTGGYVVAGMQAMLDAVRGTGAQNLVLAGGLSWSNDLSGWAAHAPHDSANNLAASAHVYYKPEYCMAASCYSTLQAFVSATQVPLVTGEVGEFDCEHSFLDGFMNWADTSGISYLAWSWSLEPCGSPGPSYNAGPSLITNWNGTPTAYGQGFKDHIAALRAP